MEGPPAAALTSQAAEMVQGFINRKADKLQYLPNGIYRVIFGVIVGHYLVSLVIGVL